MSAPIRPQDTAEERLTKLLPADVTAAFLSANAGLVAFFGEPGAAGPVFWTFVAIVAICPPLFLVCDEGYEHSAHHLPVPELRSLRDIDR